MAEALINSWDIKAAAARVLQAEAAARAARSQFLPAVGVGGDWTTARSSQRAPPPSRGAWIRRPSSSAPTPRWPATNWICGAAFCRANEAARARLLATEAARQTVLQTLVAQVATAYLSLLELDYELEIARNTLEASSDSPRPHHGAREGGVASMQDVQQARILVATAQAAIAETHRRIEQKENELSLLLGRNPGSPARGEGLLRQKLDVAVPPGLPSSLIDRRPDIRAAEQAFVAANADIGQAKAAFFPQVTLTGLYGYQPSLFRICSAPRRGPGSSGPRFRRLCSPAGHCGPT